MGPEDFDRPLHMILGLPFDAVDMPEVVAQLRSAARSRKRCFISTPNLNFLIAARSDPAFRQSVFKSDLSIADGMPIVWLARVLGIPLPGRVPGSGLVEALRAKPEPGTPPLRVFFFGGENDIARAACRRLNAMLGGMRCVGVIDPGFGSPEELSRPAHIDAINSAKPDFLIVSLGAKKGQAWIVANMARLDVPAVAHLGAVIKFIAGNVLRAPPWVQRLGLEWLWRIREEPGLWRRYWRDGIAFVALLATRVLPLALWTWSAKLRGRAAPGDALTMDRGQPGRRVVKLGLCLSVENINAVRDAFKALAAAGECVDLDFSAVRYLDSAFLGQLHVLHGIARSGAFDLRLIGMPRQLRRVIGWNLCDSILD